MNPLKELFSDDDFRKKYNLDEAEVIPDEALEEVRNAMLADPDYGPAMRLEQEVMDYVGHPLGFGLKIAYINRTIEDPNERLIRLKEVREHISIILQQGIKLEEDIKNMRESTRYDLDNQLIESLRDTRKDLMNDLLPDLNELIGKLELHK